MPIRPLAVLRHADFRWLGAAMILTSVGSMGEIVVVGWLVLELTDSPFLVGAAMGMRMLPLFIVGVPAGVLADRFPRHRVLIATSAGQALAAAALGGLTLQGGVSVSHVLAVTFASGVIRGIEQAARQGYAHDVVGAAGLVHAFAVLGIAMRTGWLVGSLAVGAVIARLGSGAAFLVVAAGYLMAAAALLPVSSAAPSAPAASGSLWQGVASFVTALRRDRVLPLLMALTAGAEVLGFAHQAVLPSLARDVLRAGPEGLGALNAARSAGGILALVAVSLRDAGNSGGARFLAVLKSFGAGLVALGVAPYVFGFAGVVVVLTAVNAVGALSDLLAQSLMQLSARSDLRGRVGGAWVVSIGLAPLGQLQIGALASLFGVSVALGVSGAGLVALAGAVGLLVPRMRRL
jgi:hypothetical protein